ncbi:DUF6493 family protein [Nonomuraea sp. NPDC005983]|uniref:DUF7824 domain-containing protein n=1 Tax=Nonomuraea sp. NPDC005983 TaxID=3155595 RepID=UPI0033B5BFC7
MNPWREVVHRIEVGDSVAMARLLASLNDLGRRAVAVQLPGYLSERLGQGWDARWEVERQAARFRMAGAACLGGAAQVASWLNRRELRDVDGPRTDAERILSLIRNRPEEWRKDLAARLVERLRPGVARWQRDQGPPGWDLAAGLAVETGVDPSGSDAFVAGWVWRMAGMRGSTAVLRDDPLLDSMVPRIFEADGVAEALAWDQMWNSERTLVDALAELAAEGRLKRDDLLRGCAGRFLVGGEPEEIAPFVALWRALHVEVTEVPALDFVRLLPSSSSAFVQLAVEELRRVDDAGGLSDELFAEAVQALAFRPEKKHVTSALQWIAKAVPARTDGALTALALVFAQDTPALRDRAVRLAVKLASRPAAKSQAVDRAGWEAVREAAAGLPDELRERVAAMFGEVEAAVEDVPVLSAPVVNALAELLPPIASLEELAHEVESLRWPDEPEQFERILAALVEMAHRDRGSLAEALRPWFERMWQPMVETEVESYVHDYYEYYTHPLLARCVLAVIMPSSSRKLTAALDQPKVSYAPSGATELFVLRRIREIVTLLESGATLPVLLATPTAPTGHLDPETLVARMERLEGAEPLPADFAQALLRLPRRIDPVIAERAGKLRSEAGRNLAAWLRAGGLPDPVATDRGITPPRIGTVGGDAAPRQETTAPELPEDIRRLWTVGHMPAYARDTMWWPSLMPSHREAVAAWLMHPLRESMSSRNGHIEVVARLVHGDGPVGAVTAAAITIGMGHRAPAQRAAAADALITLASRDEVPAADFGSAIGRLVSEDLVKLNRLASALEEATPAGAHAAVWAILAEALPSLLPAPGAVPRAGLGQLLAIAVKAAVLTGARGDIPGLADLAARKGTSRVAEEARRLHRQLA